MAFKLGLAQIKQPTDGDVVALVRRYAQQATDSGVDLLAFPEYLMTPFKGSPREYASSAEPLDGPFAQSMSALAVEHGLLLAFSMNEAVPARVSDGAAETHPVATGENPLGSVDEQVGDPISSPSGSAVDDRPFNTIVLADETGNTRLVYRKTHLFDDGSPKESDFVAPGNVLPEPVSTPFGSIAFAICYDLRFPEVARSAALGGADLLVYPASWFDGPYKLHQWKTLLAARAIENNIFVAGLCRADGDCIGNSCVFDPQGREIACAGTDEQLLVADIDMNRTDLRATLQHRRANLYRD